MENFCANKVYKYIRKAHEMTQTYIAYYYGYLIEMHQFSQQHQGRFLKSMHSALKRFNN